MSSLEKASALVTINHRGTGQQPILSITEYSEHRNSPRAKTVVRSNRLLLLVSVRAVTITFVALGLDD